jgi:predicted RNA binding protein YcfA (HicA-like mRNA interferase family)
MGWNPIRAASRAVRGTLLPWPSPRPCTSRPSSPARATGRWPAASRSRPPARVRRSSRRSPTPRGGGGLPRRGAGPGDVTDAAGDLVRRPRPGVTSRLPRGVSGKQAVSALERAGFVAVRTKGDHQILRHPEPRPGAYVTVGRTAPSRARHRTLAGILRRIGMTAEELPRSCGSRRRRPPSPRLVAGACRGWLDCAAEAWPSGRRHTPGKRVGGQLPRGFEPLSLRHTNGSSQPRFHSGRCRWARTGSVPAAIWRHPGPSPGGPRALPSRTGTDTGRYRA